MSAVPSNLEGRPNAEPVTEPVAQPLSEPVTEPSAPAPTAPTRPLSRNVTPQLSNEEVHALRQASFAKLFERWNGISHKYGTIAPEEDDEIDLITGEITCDRGRIRALKTRAFAKDLPFVEDNDDDDDDGDDGDDEEDEGEEGDDSDASMLLQEDDATPEPDPQNGIEEGHPLLQDQPWTAEDDRDLEEFMKVERMRRLAAGDLPQDDEPLPSELDMDAASNVNMGPGQMDVIAMLVRREVERMLGGTGLQPTPPFPHAAARASAARSSAASTSRHPQHSNASGSSSAARPPPVAKHRQVERTASLPHTPTPVFSTPRSTSLPSIPSALKNGSTPRPARLSLSASKVRFADDAAESIPGVQDSPLSSSMAKGKGRMAGERPNEDGPPRRRSAPPPRTRLSVEITRRERPASEEPALERQSASPSPMSPADPPRRRKRRISDEESDPAGERARYSPPNVYLKSLSYHDGKLRECRTCLEAGEPRSRYAALCRGRIDELMCRFPKMTEEEVDAAIAYREEEEANYEASQKPEARTKKRTKLAPRVSEIVTEIPTSWRPRPGDERYSMAPHRVRGGSFKRCKLCVVAGGVREKRSMFCMGRSGHGKCAFEFEDPSGSSGDEEETPEQAAIKQMEHRLLRAQNARMGNVARALKKEEIPAAPARKSTTPYVSYRQQSTRPGLPATRGPSKAPEGEELNPRAPNGRLKPRCGPCLRAGGVRAERAFLCPGSGRPKYCDYAPGAAPPPDAPTSNEDGEVAADEKEPLAEVDANQDPVIQFIVQQPRTPAKNSVKAVTTTPTSGKKPSIASAKKTTPAPAKSTPASVKPKLKSKKRPRHSRLGREESSADDYETEESDLSLSLADSDESLDSSASEAEHPVRRYNRESMGYNLRSDESHDASGAQFDSAADDEFEGVDTSMESDTVDPQILRNVAAGMNDFVPCPNTNKYAPYLSFSDGGDGWATCPLCEEAGGSRAECAMWCYGRDGQQLCRLDPGWVPHEEPRRGSHGPFSPDQRAFSPDQRAFSPDQRVFSPDRRVFSPEHSPDPLESDVEMDDVVPIGELAEDVGDDEPELEVADSSFEAPAPVVRRTPANRSPAVHSTPPPDTLRKTVAKQRPQSRSQTPPRITINGVQAPHAQYRDPAAFVASSDPAPSSSPRSAASYASPLPRAADGLQVALARSIQRDYLATSPRRTQST